MDMRRNAHSNNTIRTDSAEYMAAMRQIADILEQEERDPGYFLRQYQQERIAAGLRDERGEA
jgi:hypothetical protein